METPNGVESLPEETTTLTLLVNGECSGIERGGRSAVQAGMLFVVCSDDPTYLHQFPLEEMSW